MVLGALHESAYDAVNLVQIAARIEASLQHQEAADEFVTDGAGADQRRRAQRSKSSTAVTRRHCWSATARSPQPGTAEASLPLGLAGLIPEVREVSTIPLKPRRPATTSTPTASPRPRDRQGRVYPLERSGALLGLPDLGTALDRLIEDVLRHVGHTLQDDAAMLLIGRGQP